MGAKGRPRQVLGINYTPALRANAIWGESKTYPHIKTLEHRSIAGSPTTHPHRSAHSSNTYVHHGIAKHLLLGMVWSSHKVTCLSGLRFRACYWLLGTAGLYGFTGLLLRLLRSVRHPAGFFARSRWCRACVWASRKIFRQRSTVGLYGITGLLSRLLHSVRHPAGFFARSRCCRIPRDSLHDHDGAGHAFGLPGRSCIRT